MRRERWIAVGASVRRHNMNAVALTKTGVVTEREAEANARLFAQAGTMLELLEEAQKQIADPDLKSRIDALIAEQNPDLRNQSAA